MYGVEVAPRLLAPFHEHIFAARLDMSVDGLENSVQEVNTVTLPHGHDNPHGNAFTVRETVLASEQGAQRNGDFNAARYWKIESADRRNVLGQPTAYRLMSASPVPIFSHPQSSVAQRCSTTAWTEVA